MDFAAVSEAAAHSVCKLRSQADRTIITNVQSSALHPGRSLSMNKRHFLSFVAKTIAAQVTTYFLAGAVFYPLLTKPYYEGPNPIFAVFLRTEADMGLFAHVVNWFLPAEILRGIQIGR